MGFRLISLVYEDSQFECNAFRRVVQPTTNVLFYWQKDTKDNCGGEYGSRPCFSPEFISVMGVAGWVQRRLSSLCVIPVSSLCHLC